MLKQIAQVDLSQREKKLTHEKSIIGGRYSNGEKNNRSLPYFDILKMVKDQINSQIISLLRNNKIVAFCPFDTATPY